MEVNNSLAVTQSTTANSDHHPNFIEVKCQRYNPQRPEKPLYVGIISD